MCLLTLFACSCVQVDELNDKLKDLESTCSPIISKMYQSAQGGEGGMPGGGMPGGAAGASSGPTVEEVD